MIVYIYVYMGMAQKTGMDRSAGLHGYEYKYNIILFRYNII